MNYVEPIRDINLLENICDYLESTNTRNYLLFMMGIYTGLRVSDILRLKVKDVKDKDYLTIREQKTNKQKIIKLNPILKRALKKYLVSRESKEFLIKSRQGYNNPIDRTRAYQILKDIGEAFGIENLGTHSMRKTFGYHYYRKSKDVVTLQKIFNHSSPSVTLHYIGIIQDDLNKAYSNLKYY
ncbi:MAG: site-specific integrase [Clostridium sp.]|uniref:site-specific integrase n=1 Tax=Intestinibacter bartlettii TaxID=261299 RepID=UPI000D78DD27|nr:site-specific integrase [Intestinibacter bartlettii]MDU2692785.1 site-specific integrase [Intestinibacter bartlettii]PWM78458.1 MAG: site-specific integrase [Clostridium sp.]